MARRKTSRVTVAVLAAVAVIGVGAYLLKRPATTAVGTTALLAEQPGPTLDTATAQLAQPRVAPELLRTDGATTQPVAADATPPVVRAVSGDALFQEASKLKDAGDIVTARDRVNDALVNGRLTGSDEAEAKTFLADLNAKIILGTQKFPADPYNKLWKVEPGTALSRLARRFDVTANLLCQVNGLSSPHKLRAGVTIKTIQGPFHLVVSKSKFEADLYLGAAGGPGSHYVKTYRVGLGSDSSTPTGLWRVSTGKVENPVYYSPRGEGVIAADDPKNPLGERWLPLEGIEGGAVGQESYGIHGTIEPDSIGKNMSMGCIRLLHDDIVQVYDLLVENKSTVRVVD